MSMLLAAGLFAAQQLSPPSYESLVERYARGERAEAVAGLGFLSYNDAIQGYGLLKAAAEQASRVYDPRQADAAERAAELERCRGLLRAAVMLHWDRDDADRPPAAGTEQPRPCPGRQAELADRYAALLTRWPETRDFARRFYLAVSHGCQWDFCLDAALRFARNGLKLIPRDADLLLGAGSVLEERAALARITSRAGLASLRPSEREYRQGELAARQQILQDARRDLEEAVAADATLLLARVRLGRVLWRLGEAELAKNALEQAIANEPQPALLLLARLFLGEVHEDAGRLEPAIEEYRRALALDPTSQTAAVALSQALRLAGDVAGSRRVLEESLAHAGRRRFVDLFWNYYTTNALGFEEQFDDLRRETLR
jgi:tetratricopeptide (TPR) repeat protein